jgi:ubiquinone/menaquinone biosynthesis C-methylase UbiE
MITPDFSSIAKQYAESRPGYPPELYDFLASLVGRRDLAWDSATGNGQAALELARRFDRVIATDLSAEQIRYAVPHARVEYRVAPSERSGLEDHSADLIAVASAIHWFDLDGFFAEARRVLRPGGVLAAWSYHAGRIEPPFGEILERFYHEVVQPYFAPGSKLVDEGYRGLTLPGAPIDTPRFWMSARWNLDQMLAFIGTWSGTREYIRVKGESPVPIVAEPLARAWGERKSVRTLRWPLAIRVSRT